MRGVPPYCLSADLCVPRTHCWYLSVGRAAVGGRIPVVVEVRLRRAARTYTACPGVTRPLPIDRSAGGRFVTPAAAGARLAAVAVVAVAVVVALWLTGRGRPVGAVPLV